jgi:RNA polymerase sigma-70 factor (ECF subfamily)
MSPQPDQPTSDRGPTPDEAALAAIPSLYETLRGEVFVTALRISGSTSVAEDVVQEAFLKLVREAQRGRMPDQPRAWLHRVAGNDAVSRARRVTTARRAEPRLQAQEERMDPSTESVVIARQTADELGRAIGTLPAIPRQVLLCAAAGLSGQEIARRVGRSEIAVRVLLHRTRSRLRSELQLESAVDGRFVNRRISPARRRHADA